MRKRKTVPRRLINNLFTNYILIAYSFTTSTLLGLLIIHKMRNNLPKQQEHFCKSYVTF